MRCAADCPDYSGLQNLSSSNCTAVISSPQTSLYVTSAPFWNQVKFNTWLCTYSGCTSSMLWMSVSARVRACVLNCPVKIGPSRAISAVNVVSKTVLLVLLHQSQLTTLILLCVKIYPLLWDHHSWVLLDSFHVWKLRNTEWTAAWKPNISQCRWK